MYIYIYISLSFHLSLPLPINLRRPCGPKKKDPYVFYIYILVIVACCTGSQAVALCVGAFSMWRVLSCMGGGIGRDIQQTQKLPAMNGRKGTAEVFEFVVVAVVSLIMWRFMSAPPLGRVKFALQPSGPRDSCSRSGGLQNLHERSGLCCDPFGTVPRRCFQKKRGQERGKRTNRESRRKIGKVLECTKGVKKWQKGKGQALRTLTSLIKESRPSFLHTVFGVNFGDIFRLGHLSPGGDFHHNSSKSHDAFGRGKREIGCCFAPPSCR